MVMTRLTERILRWLGKAPAAQHSAETPYRGPKVHVIILDGTMSSLKPGCETHAGATYRLLQGMGSQLSLFYESGIQWQSWQTTHDVMAGRGINRQIRRAYGYLASRYRPGDRVYLMGYSRGAYAVRSLAGVIDMVGLLRPEHATVRNIRTAYRHYETHPDGPHAHDFARAHCHDNVPIEMIGVWDTVKALGLRFPGLTRFSDLRHGFHNHELGPSVRNGFHALALDETRVAYEPVLWSCPEGWHARVEQVWFRGNHADVGGQLNGFEPARPLANIPLVWMLERAEGVGLPLPPGWRLRFACDVTAPSTGGWRGWAKIFLLRRRRVWGRDASERLHESVTGVEQRAASWRAGPLAALMRHGVFR
ncbi:MAG: DUF2235 domain-containing protein [Marinibacterium sp.]|nr:DUF2235 domain-containing protein [Marinibacterium sp.]